jgi:hypothetical protein
MVKEVVTTIQPQEASAMKQKNSVVGIDIALCPTTMKVDTALEVEVLLRRGSADFIRARR